jgi:hypothetical protein
MSYEMNVGLARKVSQALRKAGLKVTRTINESMMTVRSEDGGVVVVQCMKEHEHNFDIALWRPPEGLERGGRAHGPASRHLLRTLVSLFRENGLNVDAGAR